MGTTCRFQLTVGEANLLGLAVSLLRVRDRHQRRLRSAGIQQKLGDGLVNPAAGFAALRGKRPG